jgi:cytochrome c nitrite reductase small subunit
MLIGALAGLGAYTFDYGEGLSYFSTDPRACKNCHVMNEQYASWSRAPHHAVAGCVDCHLPHEFVAKYIAKADNGYRHSKASPSWTFTSHHDLFTERSCPAGELFALPWRSRPRHRTRQHHACGCGQLRALPSRCRPRRQTLT